MSENTENPSVRFNIESDDEGNIKIDIAGKGGELVQVLASVVDDDPSIKELFEYVLLLVSMKQANDTGETLDGFMNPPVGEA